MASNRYNGASLLWRSWATYQYINSFTNHMPKNN
jgi:hypothetical protein